MDIISKEVIYEPNLAAHFVIGALALLIILITGIVWIVHLRKTNTDADAFSARIITILFSTVILFFTLILLNQILWKVPTDRYTYKVNFDNAEAVNDAFEQWNFISYEDGIYTFEDKEE